MFVQIVLRFGAKAHQQLGEVVVARRQKQTPPASLLAAPAQRKEAAVQLCQRARQAARRFAQRLLAGVEGRFFKARRIHVPRAIHKVVRLVDEKDEIAAFGKKALEADDGVEQVVVVAHDAVAPVGKVERKLERAQALGLGESENLLARKDVALLQKAIQSGVDAVVVAVGARTGLRRADALLQRANFVFRRQHNAFCAQRAARLLHVAQRVQRGLPGDGFRRQVKNALAAALAHGLQGGEQCGSRFADAGGGHRQQALFVAHGAVHAARQRVLPGAVLRKGERQRTQALGAHLLPGALHLGPRGVQMQRLQQELLQRVRFVPAPVADDLVGVDLVVGDLHRHARKALLCAQKRAVTLGLRPVQRLEILGQQLGGRGGRLDLVDRHIAAAADDAVRAPLQPVVHAVHRALALENDLRLVFLARIFLQFAVDAAALVRAVKAGKAAVDGAVTPDEFHQRAHGEAHFAGHGSSLPSGEN